MWKKMAKSGVILLLVSSAMGMSSAAYLTSQVSASTSKLEFGTVRMTVDSIDAGGSPYMVSTDGSTPAQNMSLPALTNLQPGDVKNIYLLVRNTGSLNFDYRGNLSGSWGDANLDGQKKLNLTNVHRFDDAECTADAQCAVLKNWMNSDSTQHFVGTQVSMQQLGDMSAASGVYFGHPNTVSDGSFTLAADQYSIMKLEFSLDPSAGNEYQGKDFTYTFTAQAKQTTAANF